MTKFEEGMTLPAGKAIVAKAFYGSGKMEYTDKVGSVVYATGWKSPYGSPNPGIPVNFTKGNTQAGQAWCTEWTEVVEPLTDAQMNDLAKRALAAAKERGYCDETKNVLADLGLPTDFTRKRKVTVELEIDETTDVEFAGKGTGRGLMVYYNQNVPTDYGIAITSMNITSNEVVG